MAVPIQLPTTALNETFGGITYHIEGELVPVLHLELNSVGVYFEHHILLWKADDFSEADDQHFWRWRTNLLEPIYRARKNRAAIHVSAFAER